MSRGLYKLGRFAADRPWSVIFTWLTISLVVVGLASAFGRDLEDSMAVPGLDSQQAIDLLSATGNDSAGLTAQVVVTPANPTTTFASPEEAKALGDLQVGLQELPNVLAATEPVLSPDGRVALIRAQYPVMEQLGSSDLENLKEFGARSGDGVLQVELGGELFFSFEEPQTDIGEMIGIIAAAVILLVAFGSVIAMGLPIGMALFGLALGITSMTLFNHLIDIPSVDVSTTPGSAIGGGQIVIETLVRDRILYVELSDTLGAGNGLDVVGYKVRLADGRPLPGWVYQAANGTLLAEVPADAKPLDLRITSELSDGSLIEQHVRVEPVSGEIQPLDSDGQRQRGTTFNQQLHNIERGGQQ